MSHKPGQKVTDSRILERVRECYANDETLPAGGVTAATVAEELPIVAMTTKRRLRALAEQGDLERDWGLTPHGKQLAYAPVENTETDQRLVADGGSNR
ncbi:helix-turn-helix domain-containing protein [Natronorubrum daqingense]|uniref:Transcriptional regulator n=1 Tax=Natronorubrum daqingense TaxID=588898 RepID=A0A1N7G4T7_9EURY|nr:hypothetical protein [Natronorubrum daqingense]APX98731.1 hypothetical protein BB347_18675 [Natronorubrum daqingense]SIS07582.1 hypothetical protein SAMN05421809_3723 [Natronorubrum daqingense]